VLRTDLQKETPRCSATRSLGTLDEARAYTRSRSTITRRDGRERTRLHCYTPRLGEPTEVTIKRNQNVLAQTCRFCATRLKRVEYPTHTDAARKSRTIGRGIAKTAERSIRYGIRTTGDEISITMTYASRAELIHALAIGAEARDEARVRRSRAASSRSWRFDALVHDQPSGAPPGGSASPG
jgi:hypothetical protein